MYTTKVGFDLLKPIDKEELYNFYHSIKSWTLGPDTYLGVRFYLSEIDKDLGSLPNWTEKTACTEF